jgi:thiosulfate dehydrogenase [quinone] large subunit
MAQKTRPVSKQSTASSGTRRPRTILGAPPRAWALAGWALLPLRLFLGVTFTFAGLQKIANPDFFSKTSNNGVYVQMLQAVRHSPISFLLSHLVEHSTLLGWAMALGELAIGIGLLLGLWGRIAAIGGVAIALSLFLSVSFHTSPYYLGSDLAYAMAFTPFVLAGTPVLSLDALIRRRANAQGADASQELVVVPMSAVRKVCQNAGANDTCNATGAACVATTCPVLQDPPSTLARRGVDDLARRQVVLGGAVAAVTAVGAAATAAVMAGVGRAGSTSTPTTTPVTLNPGSSTANGRRIGKASDVPVGGSATFSLPDGTPGIVLQPTSGTFAAYNAACPHQGCPVDYFKSQDLLVCPCHGSQFNPQDGALEVGPAVTGLTPYPVTVVNGYLYVKV